MHARRLIWLKVHTVLHRSRRLLGCAAAPVCLAWPTNDHHRSYKVGPLT